MRSQAWLRCPVGVSVVLATSLLASGLVACTSGPDPPPKPQQLNYITTWVGNSLASGRDHIQQEFDDIEVTDDGTVFSNAVWDEGGYQVHQFTAEGALKRSAGYTLGWGQLGGKAVAANDKFIFFARPHRSNYLAANRQGLARNQPKVTYRHHHSGSFRRSRFRVLAGTGRTR